MPTRPKTERPRLRRAERESAPIVTEAAPMMGATEAPLEGAAPSTVLSTEPEITKLSISMKPDGSIAWDRMRPSTQEAVRRLIGQGGPGAAPGAPSPAMAMMSKTLTTAIVKSIPMLAQILARMTGHTVESSARIQLTPAQQAELAPLYEAALNDYAITLGRHENLIVALGMTGLMLMEGVQQLERAKKPAGRAVNGSGRTMPAPDPVITSTNVTEPQDTVGRV